MKKVFLLIISVVSMLHAYAQDVDSLQVQSATTTIESLSLKLEKLQHDYDFMFCQNELNRINNDLKDLAQDIHIKTNELLNDIDHSRYNKETYNLYLQFYDVYSSHFDSLKNMFQSTKELVFLKATTSGFSDEEKGVLDSSLNSINKGESVVESALGYYDSVIQLQSYKRKR